MNGHVTGFCQKAVPSALCGAFAQRAATGAELRFGVAAEESAAALHDLIAALQPLRDELGQVLARLTACQTADYEPSASAQRHVAPPPGPAIASRASASGGRRPFLGEMRLGGSNLIAQPGRSSAST